MGVLVSSFYFSQHPDNCRLLLRHTNAALAHAVVHTPREGVNWKKAVCISRARESCDDFCLRIEDCLPPERCDTSLNLCTTKCSKDSDCQRNYDCKNKRCIKEDAFVGITPLITAVVLLACCCGCFRLQRRRNQPVNYNANPSAAVNSTDVNPRGTNAQQNTNVETLETVESNGEPDAIAIRGPPSYTEVYSNEPELPPPTYEEAVTAENLSSTVEG